MSELFDFVLSHDETFKSHARLASLYSDFALLKSSNPDGYAANNAAWRAALVKASRAGLTPGGNTLVFGTGETLLRDLESDEAGRPLALGCVVTDAVSDGALIPLREYLNATHSVYKKSWITVPTISGVAQWMLSQIGVGGSGSGTLPKAEFVVLASVEEASQRILRQVAAEATTPSSLVYSLDTFKETFGHARKDTPALNKTDVAVVMKHLSRDKNAAAIAEATDGAMTIKFAAPSSQAPPTPVTQNDKTIASVRSLISRLQTQVDALAPRVVECEKTARAEVAANRRERALVALRRKKAVEATLLRREDHLAQAESVLNSIDEAAGQVDMISAMDASSAVLRDLNRQVGGTERVDAVMDALQESKADVDEVNRVLAEPGMEGIDEDEIDDELEALEKESKKGEEDKAERERQKVLDEAPSAPEEEPSSKKSEEAIEKQLNSLSLES